MKSTTKTMTEMKAKDCPLHSAAGLLRDRGENACGCPAVKGSLPALTETSTHDDGRFVRTALVLGGAGAEGGRDEGGSIDVIDKVTGVRLCQINLVALRGGGIIVDVIDVEKRHATRRALAFSQTERRIVEVPEGGTLVSVDFRPKESP